MTEKVKYLVAGYTIMTRTKIGSLVKVSTGGRITIPIQTREREGIKKGDFVWILVEKHSFEGSKEKTDEEAEKQK